MFLELNLQKHSKNKPPGSNNSKAMSILNFFGRRLLSGVVARGFTNFLVKRFRMSPGAANLIFVVLAEMLARGTEKPNGAGRRFPGFGKKR